MYYCLIASLEQHTLQSDPSKIDFAALRTDIVDDLTAGDRRAVELLYGYYDVVNIIAALSGYQIPHNVLGNLSQEQIEAEIDTAPSEDEPRVSLLPTSVRYALDMIKGYVETDEELHIEQSDIERMLLENFYAECRGSKSAYLRQYIDIDRQMRNVVAGDGASIGLMADDVRESFWWQGLQEVMATTDFVEREHKMDALRWRIAEELTQAGGGLDDNGHYFDIAVVLNYIIELNILHRWASLNPEVGRKRFSEMVQRFVEQGRLK